MSSLDGINPDKKIIKEPIEILKAWGVVVNITSAIEAKINEVISSRIVFDTDSVDQHPEFFSLFLIEIETKENENDIEWFVQAIQRLSGPCNIPNEIQETVDEILKVKPEYGLSYRRASEAEIAIKKIIY